MDSETRAQRTEYNRRWRAANPDKVAAWRPKSAKRARERYRRIRAEVMAAYGGECACCQESISGFLTIDHIDGIHDAHKDGQGKRLAAPKIVELLWRALPELDPNITVLCFNCNSGRAANGGVCPHKEVMPL